MKKAEDKTADSMFDEIVETNILPDGEVDVKLLDNPAQEMENAIAEFITSAREFFDSDTKLQCETDPTRAGILCWRRLEWLALADSRLKEAFCGRDRSRDSIALYHNYRLKLLDGKRYRTDAKCSPSRESLKVTSTTPVNHSRGRRLTTMGQPTVSTLPQI